MANTANTATVRVSFFFAAGKVPEVLKLDIGDDAKERLRQAEPSGKLTPLIFDVERGNIGDILKVAALKKRFK